MSEPGPQGAIGQDDLFDRWLAYHAEQVSADEEQLAADLAAEGDGDRLVTQHRPTSDMERQVPGFEPIVMPSVARRRELAANPPKRGLRRGRTRGADDAKTATSANPGSRSTTQLPPPPPVGRRLTRSISGEEPDWLKALRDAANGREHPEQAPTVDGAATAAAATLAEPPLVAETSPVTDEPAADEVPSSADEADTDDAADAADVDADREVSPAEAAGMGWLDIIRDPTPRVAVGVDPPAETTTAPEAQVHVVAQARRQAPPAPEVQVHVVAQARREVPAPVETPDEPEPTVLSSWADRLRAGAVTPTATPAAVEEHDEPDVAEPEPEPAPDWKARLRAVPEPDVEPEPAPVVDEAPDEAEPEPAPVIVRTLQVAQARRPAAPEPAAEPAVAAEPEAAPEPEQAEPEQAAPEPEQPAPVQPAARVTSTSPIESMPEVHKFRPRRTLRTVVTLLFLIGVVLTAYLARGVYEDPTQSAVAMAAVAGFITAVIWALRATTSVTRLTVRDGQLEVARGSGTFSIDLTQRDTPLELVGTPGQRGWKALYLRNGQPPFEITPAMVDPVEFTRVVRHHRPAEVSTPA
jgi:hypothetical protein